jgi:ElaB/YqjD/DUF883 family membrane-anchored ribosome-binding protein
MANGEEPQSEGGAKERSAGKRRVPVTQREEAPRLASAVSDARRSIESMMGDWREMVEEHPWRALGMALGAGYVVGGGLLTPLTGRMLYGVLRIGVRLAALPLVRDELMSLLQTATERGRGETERRHQ